MEWIIGFFVLWVISLVSNTGYDKPRESKKENVSTQTAKIIYESNKKDNDKIYASPPSLDELKKQQNKKIEELLSKLADGEERLRRHKVKKTKEKLEKSSLKTIKDDREYAFTPPQTKEKIIKEFEKYGVFSLWHMTHRDNVEEILRKGILSNTLAYNQENPKDISNQSVQKWRNKKDPIYSKKLHDYTPTYLNIKNPMLYVKRNTQDELCLIEISLSVLLEESFIFSDGNAAARDTKFYHSSNDLEHLPWEVLNASYWNDFEDGKRKRCAEVLIYPSIESRYIKKIHCYSDFTLKKLENMNFHITKTRQLFF